MDMWVLISLGAGGLALLIIGWMVYDFIRVERGHYRK